jgi:hypothetical protein
LEVQPVLWSGFEDAGQPKCGVGRDRPPPIYDLVHSLIRDIETPGKLGLGHAPGLEELVEKNVAGMWSRHGIVYRSTVYYGKTSDAE